MKIRHLSRAAKRDPTLTGRYVTAYEKKLLKVIRKTKKEIIKLMLETLENNRIRENAVYRVDLSTFNAEVSRVIKVNYEREAVGDLTKEIRDQARRGTIRADQLMSNLGFEALVGGMPVDNLVYANIEARNLTELMSISDELKKRVIETVSAGIEAGESARVIAKDLVENTGFTDSRAIRVARTEAMHAFNAANDARYKQFGIEQVQWLTGGSNVCTKVTGFDGVFYADGCQGLNTKIFDIDKVPPHPLHPNCKCTTIPVIEEV